MELKRVLNELKSNKLFKQWEKDNKNCFFSYAFKVLDDENADGWQIGFYNKGNDKITTFSVDKNKIAMNREEEVFKKPDMKVKKINLSKLRMSFEKIIEKASEFRKKEYPKELESKIIAILQNLEPFGDIWNLTYITKAFNTLNIKVSAETGKVLQHKLSSVFDFKKDAI